MKEKLLNLFFLLAVLCFSVICIAGNYPYSTTFNPFTKAQDYTLNGRSIYADVSAAKHRHTFNNLSANPGSYKKGVNINQSVSYPSEQVQPCVALIGTGESVFLMTLFDVVNHCGTTPFVV